jgi:hypothetical protein
MVVAHAAVVLFFLVSFTDAVLDEGGDPRMALPRDRGSFSRRATEVGRHALGLLAAVLGVLLLVSQLWVGVSVLATTALVALTRGGLMSPAGRRRMELAEVVWPMAALVAPAAMVSLFERRGEAPTPLPASMLPATLLGAIMMGVFILLCMLRDEPTDRGVRARTTVTLLGRGAGQIFMLAWMALAIALAGWGATHEMWHWSAVVIVGVGAVATGWCVGARADGAAVVL